MHARENVTPAHTRADTGDRVRCSRLPAANVPQARRGRVRTRHTCAHTCARTSAEHVAEGGIRHCAEGYVTVQSVCA